MLEFEPIEPTEAERIWQFDADLDGRIFTYELKWVERTGSHYISIWDSEGELLIAGARLGIDYLPFFRYQNRPEFPQAVIMLVDMDDSAAPPEFEQLGHRLRFMTYELTEIPEQINPYNVTVV